MAANSKTGEEITYDMWIESVTWLAEKYKNDDTIIAYDLKMSLMENADITVPHVLQILPSGTIQRI